MAKNDVMDTKDTKVADTATEPKKNEEPKKDEAKKSEAEKEFCLIRWAKAIGQVCSNTGKKVNGFVHRHPYLTAGIGGAIGYGAKFAVDYFTGNDSDEAETCEVPQLPEAVEEDMDTYVLDMPDEETYEEEKTNEE